MNQFDHEKLTVYRSSIAFVAWASDLLEMVPQTLAVYGQIDRACTSIPLNIAAGNGKHTPADRCRYFDIARGSALECAACGDVLVTKSACAISWTAPRLLKAAGVLLSDWRAQFLRTVI